MVTPFNVLVESSSDSNSRHVKVAPANPHLSELSHLSSLMKRGFLKGGLGFDDEDRSNRTGPKQTTSSHNDSAPVRPSPVTVPAVASPSRTLCTATALDPQVFQTLTEDQLLRQLSHANAPGLTPQMARPEKKYCSFSFGGEECRDTLVISLEETRAILSNHAYAQYSLPSPRTEGSFRVGDAYGKGKAMFAERDIQVDEVIILERPLFVCLQALPLYISANLDKIFERITPAKRQAFHNLYTTNPVGRE